MHPINQYLVQDHIILCQLTLTCKIYFYVMFTNFPHKNISNWIDSDFVENMCQNGNVLNLKRAKNNIFGGIVKV